MKPENPYNPIEVCEVFCHRYKPHLPQPSCIRSGFCEAYQKSVCLQNAWDEGYNACAQQRISEQEGWQTDEPSEEEEGPFLLDLGDHNHRVADIYVPDTPYREAHFKDTSHIGRLMCPYTLSRHVKRWKRL